MRHLDIVRAWKDEEYRASLSAEERALLPENPAGQVQVPGTRSFPTVVTFVTLPILFPTGLTSTYYTSTYYTVALNAVTSLLKW